MGIFLHSCIACPLRIQQHLLERTSATGDSGEEVEHMHDQLNTQKYYRPSRVLWLRDQSSYRTGRTCLWARQASRAAILAIIEYSRLMLHPAFKLRQYLLPSEVHSSRSPAKFKENSLFKCCLLVATFTRVWPCCSYYVLATYIYCRLILLWKNYLMEFTPPVTVYIHSLFQLLYHLFLSQTADPPLSKATKVARLQLAGYSSSQRALLLSSLSYVSPVFHFCHFSFPISSFLIPVPDRKGLKR